MKYLNEIINVLGMKTIIIISVKYFSFDIGYFDISIVKIKTLS